MYAIIINLKEAKVIPSTSKRIDSVDNFSICGVDSYEQGLKISSIYNRMKRLGIKVNVANIYRAAENSVRKSN